MPKYLIRIVVAAEGPDVESVAEKMADAIANAQAGVPIMGQAKEFNDEQEFMEELEKYEPDFDSDYDDVVDEEDDDKPGLKVVH